MKADAQVRRGWNYFFWSAAVFNFVIGLTAMIMPGTTPDGRLVGLLIFAFGIVFALVAREPLRFAPVLWAGLLTKLGAVGLVAAAMREAQGDLPGMALMAFDLVFALGFLGFLFTHGDAEAPEAEDSIPIP